MEESLEFVTYQRRNTNSMKWDGVEEEFGQDGLLPLWIADMDIKAPRAVREVLHNAAENGIYGYYKVPDSYYDAFISWEQRQHGYTPRREEIRFMSGIVAGLFWCIQIYTQPCDACIVLTPSYGPFLNSIVWNNRTLVCSELINTDGYYTVDFEDFEKKIEKQNVKIFLLSSPHNPSGRVWTQEELKHLIAICKRHEVLVISDEIHHDIIPGDKRHMPAMLAEPSYSKLIMLTAASKTFNLASFQNSFAIIRDQELRNQFDRFQKANCIYKGNRLGYEVVEAAYQSGEDWLEQVLTLVRNNHCLLRESFALNAPLAVVSPMEGTYLAWVDLGAYVAPKDLDNFIQSSCGLALSLSSDFYPAGSDRIDSHVRFNLATSPEILGQALDALFAHLKDESCHE